MRTVPKLSFIVISYNYAHYVGQCIRSILAQSVQDFEIIVVDDASTDNSVEVVRSFNDARIRLFRNEMNRGGAWSYNRAVTLAEGEFLVHLDSDDWIAPNKCERQLLAFHENPTLDIVGSFIEAVDQNGERHRNLETEAHFNQSLDLNVVGSWIVRNSLCRSSVTMRREAHLRIGLDDPTMTYACDFELWTRALKEGCRFLVLPEALTHYRWHGGNITHRNPGTLFLETTYLMGRNVVPAIEERASYLGLGRILTWIVDHDEFALLTPRARYRLLASLLGEPNDRDFASYRDRLFSSDDDHGAERLGKLCLALTRYGPSRIPELAYWRDRRIAEDVKTNWFLPRIAHLEGLAAENERVRQEWYLPRLEQLEGLVAEHERAKQEWYLPQISRLEALVAERERARQDWFEPQLNRLEALVAENERVKQEWFLPQIARLEARIAECERDAAAAAQRASD